MEESEVQWEICYSNPPFSCIVTVCTVVLIYFPHIFFRIIFSPVLILTSILLISLLRLGSIQSFKSKTNQESREENKENNRGAEYPEQEEESKFLKQEPEFTSCKPETHSGLDPKENFEEAFVEWNVRAPLEVIYEAYEGEEEDQQNKTDLPGQKDDPNSFVGIERLPSLSLCYPESDSDSSSSESDFPLVGDWVSAENARLRWLEDYREGLIEISLDHHHGERRKQIELLDFHGEEENLIEIEISPARGKN